MTRRKVAIANDLFNLDYDYPSLTVFNRESQTQEFKQSYDDTKKLAYCKSIAGMANNKGGIIIFGISEKPKKLVGFDTTKFPDSADITKLLKQYFEPVPSCGSFEARVSGRNLIILHVEKSYLKPVVCKTSGNIEVNGKSKQILETSAIYYRYDSETTKIGFAELNLLLAERRDADIKAVMENLTMMNKVGFDKVGIIDASKHNSKTTALYVSDRTAKNLNLIRKGSLTDKPQNGFPAYHVVAEVTLNKVGAEVEKPFYFAKDVQSKMVELGYTKFQENPHNRNLSRQFDGKNPKRGFGKALTTGQWVWYESWLEKVKAFCEKNRDALV